MKVRAVPTLILCLLLAACRQPATGSNVMNVIFDHDGAIDDAIAMAILLRSPDVRVHAMTICPADSYLEPATRATQLFLDQLGGRDITIAQGHSEGINPFPDEYRQDGARLLTIPALAGKEPSGRNPIAKEDAAHLLATRLAEHSFVILATGPLTNIADALKLDPGIAKNIERIYVMGGAVRVKGNVEQKEHDGTAEWNFFNEPHAAAAVIHSGIPITLVPLDATNNVPVTRGFVDRLRAQPSAASQLAAQSLDLVEKWVSGAGYYFWDPLTAALLLDRTVVRTETLKVRVVSTGPSQGRIVEDPDGVPIEVALHADQSKVETLLLAMLRR